MEIQLQIYLIMGVGGLLIAALILSNSLLIYYVVKLYGKLSRKDSNQRTNAAQQQHINAYTNPALNFDDELNRRFTQYTPDTTVQREPKKNKSSKGSVNSQKIKNVIDVSEEFRWRQTDMGEVSQYNSNVVLRDNTNMDLHEGRTSFNDRDYH